MTRNQQHLDSKIQLPDFFVPGAMKSGTTTLCAILDRHPDIFISKPKEPLFFDRDDVWVQTVFFSDCRDEWFKFNWEHNRNQLLEEYGNVFSGAREGQILGEGSPTYMFSRKAADRIAELKPDAKFIFMLRDPVARAYSNYWHLVRSGRAIYSFERQMQFEPLTILHRGLYKDYIGYYLTKFPREQMLFCIFEEFISNTQVEIDRIFRFLEVESKIDVGDAPKRKNVARSPKNFRAHLLLNAIGRRLGVDMIGPVLKWKSHRKPNWTLILRVVRKLQRMNMTIKEYPPMAPDTHRQLEEFYSRENKGLEALIGTTQADCWSYLKEK